MKAHGGEKALVFLDAALLIQTGMHKKGWLRLAGGSLHGDAYRRVMQRDALTREEVLHRIRSQMSDEEMKLYADEVIVNDGTLEELHDRVSALLRQREYVR